MEVTVIANIGKKTKNISGQTARSNSIIEAIIDLGYTPKIIELDGTKNYLDLIKLFFKIVFNVLIADKIIVISAKNGVKVLNFLFKFLRTKPKTVLIPTGGWFDVKGNNKKSYLNYKAIFIQSSNHHQFIKNKLGDNVFHLPNFRKFYNYNTEENIIKKPVNNILKIIFNSRVTKDKGIFEAITAVNEINKVKINLNLDVYGQISDQIKFLFMNEISNNPQINYRGEYLPEDVKSTLINYDLMLFPSYYFGEGQPGVLLDAIFNAIPVIASDWKFNNELVINEINGFLVKPKSSKSIKDALIRYIENPNLINVHSNNTRKLKKIYGYENILNNLKNKL